jgi:hypothetical protein
MTGSAFPGWTGSWRPWASGPSSEAGWPLFIEEPRLLSCCATSHPSWPFYSLSDRGIRWQPSSSSSTWSHSW